jgi:hypothetical protein
VPLPSRLEAVLETFDLFSDPADRTSLLLSYADQFQEVPKAVATRPFAQDHLVPHCESEAYVWALKQPDGTLKLHFAVENPSGVSARRSRRFSTARSRACRRPRSRRSRRTSSSASSGRTSRWAKAWA